MPMTLRAGELIVKSAVCDQQEAGTIEGAVRDEAGEPAGNVVVVVQPDPGTRMRTLAERQGLSVARDRSRPIRHRPRADSPASRLDWRATMEMSATSGVVVEVPAGGLCVHACDQRR